MQPSGATETLPFDLDAEKCVLGSMLRDPQCVTEVFAGVERDDFYLPRHRELYGLMERLDARNSGACDAVTVAHEVDRLRLSEKLGGREYLEELMTSVPSLAFLENHVRIVRELAVRRALLRAAEEIQRNVSESEGELRDLLDHAEQSVFEVGDRLVGGEMITARQLISEQLDRILRNESGHDGLETGYIDLDERQGFRPGDLVVLAARPSMGKTALALNILERVALRSGGAVLLFSLEMPRDQIIHRMLSSHAKVRHEALRRGMLDKADRARITRTAGELSNSRIFIDDSSQPGLSEIRAKARRLKRDGQLDLVVIDYLQLLTTRAESRQQEISTISRNLKSMARDLHVPVLALAQLNRAAERRDTHRPMLSDLRESGAIEQDADMVMLLFREEYYESTPENQGLAELIVAKNRNGPTGTVTLRFTQELMRFENAVREPSF
ncbi:MAG TPA: replicative DNA helicase [Planctomycetota bacterium]